MSEENKEKPFEMPMVPFFGLDMARELGSIDARLKQLEVGQARLEAKIDDAKTEAKVDKMTSVFNRLDEHTKSLDSKLNLSISLNSAVLAGIIAQFFFK